MKKARMYRAFFMQRVSAPDHALQATAIWLSTVL